MPLEIVGQLPPGVGSRVDAFVSELGNHEFGGPVDGRLIVAEPHADGVTPTMHRALARWMRASDFDAWERAQDGRPVATAGKVFIGDDEIVTSVLCPLPGMQIEFLGLVAHELVEMEHRGRAIREGWIEPELNSAEQIGATFFDEYRAERLRAEISAHLGWAEGVLDSDPGLVLQTNDLQQELSQMPQVGEPPVAFWMHWLNIARVWAMVLGRCDGGSSSAYVELERWAEHPLIDGGWAPVRSALGQMYSSHDADRDQLEADAAELVARPIERYGQEAWIRF